MRQEFASLLEPAIPIALLVAVRKAVDQPICVPLRLEPGERTECMWVAEVRGAGERSGGAGWRQLQGFLAGELG